MIRGCWGVDTAVAEGLVMGAVAEDLASPAQAAVARRGIQLVVAWAAVRAEAQVTGWAVGLVVELEAVAGLVMVAVAGMCLVGLGSVPSQEDTGAEARVAVEAWVIGQAWEESLVAREAKAARVETSGPCFGMGWDRTRATEGLCSGCNPWWPRHHHTWWHGFRLSRPGTLHPGCTAWPRTRPCAAGWCTY